MSSNPQTPKPEEEAPQAEEDQSTAVGEQQPGSRMSQRSKTQATAEPDVEADGDPTADPDAVEAEAEAPLDEEEMPEMEPNEDPAADRRNIRKIIAEDPEWNLATVPGLADLSLSTLVSNFEYNAEVLHKVNAGQKAKVLSRLPVDVSKKVTGPLVQDEGYWRRVCKSRWQVCDVSQYGGSWKRMYFERELQAIIEFTVPGTTDPTQLGETLTLAGPFVRRLCVTQLLPPVGEDARDEEASERGSEAGDEKDTNHLDFGPLLPQLPHLTELRLCYTVKDCGMNFEWNLFQFTAKDCIRLAEAVAACTQLRVFQLSRSKVDCDRCRVLISKMLDHPSLQELDFSHNSIGDRGARALGKFINGRSQLVKLDASDNQIRAMGAQAIAHALLKNTTLLTLNLRLNRMGDDGGQAIGKALIRNSTLQHVNISSNELSEPTATILAQVVAQNKTLQHLDLSNNRLGGDGGKQLQEGMERNSTILEMDLRFTECGQESEYRISQVLEKNQERREKRLNK